MKTTLLFAQLLILAAYGYAPGTRVETKTLLRSSSKQPQAQPYTRNKRCDPCENIFQVEDDKSLDRRESLYAMMGWALGSMVVFPSSAEAKGEANIVLPNPIEGLYDRSTKQCLQESLGNRECLVYAGEGETVFKGIEAGPLIQRIESASLAMATIPDLIDEKKWSKVTGVLLGPMGELTRTMGQLADVSPNAAVARDKIKVMKTDLFALQGAVDRKEGEKARKYHAAATKSLADYRNTISLK